MFSSQKNVVEQSKITENEKENEIMPVGLSTKDRVWTAGFRGRRICGKCVAIPASLKGDLHAGLVQDKQC